MNGRFAGTCTVLALALASISTCASAAFAQQSPVAEFYRGKTITIIAGASAGGGSSVHESTLVVKNLLGMKLKVVTGYPGVKEVGLAMDRGEVQGILGLAYTTVRQFFPEHRTGAKGFKAIPQPGEEVEALVRRMYAAPPELVARVAAATRN
jgi:hypothetical protein